VDRVKKVGRHVTLGRIGVLLGLLLRASSGWVLGGDVVLHRSRIALLVRNGFLLPLLEFLLREFLVLTSKDTSLLRKLRRKKVVCESRVKEVLLTSYSKTMAARGTGHPSDKETRNSVRSRPSKRTSAKERSLRVRRKCTEFYSEVASRRLHDTVFRRDIASLAMARVLGGNALQRDRGDVVRSNHCETVAHRTTRVTRVHQKIPPMTITIQPIHSRNTIQTHDDSRA
jgi:hypothetical protein